MISKKKRPASKRTNSRVGLNYADVTGWVCDGDLYCLRHGDDTCDPIFAGSEWEYQPHCSVCGDEIDVNVLECECTDPDCEAYDHDVSQHRRCREFSSEVINGKRYCKQCAEDLRDRHPPPRPPRVEDEDDERDIPTPTPRPPRVFTEEERQASREASRRLMVPSEVQRSGLPPGVDPEAVERALQRSRSDDEVLGVHPRKKASRRSRVGADPEEMTPDLAFHLARERGFPPLRGTPQELEEGYVNRELAAQILDKLKNKKWRANTGPQQARYNELTQYRINEAEAAFQEVTDARAWTREWTRARQYNYEVQEGESFRLRLIWSIPFEKDETLNNPYALMFSPLERFGNKWKKITSVQALEKSLEAYRKASVGRRRPKETKVAGRLPSESTISPAAIRRRYPNAPEQALRANDPNVHPMDLEWSARHFPEVVQQNPVLPLIALEDPNRGRRIQEVTKDALRRRKEQEILAVKEGNLRIDQWLEREKKNWVTTLLQRSGLPPGIDPEAVERALSRSRSDDDEVLGVHPRKRGPRRSQVGADPEMMTPDLAFHLARERGLPPLTGTPQELAEGYVRREIAAQILDKLKKIRESRGDWGGKTKPQSKRYAELAQYRINDAEAGFQEVTDAVEWTRNKAIERQWSNLPYPPGGLLRLRLLWSTEYESTLWADSLNDPFGIMFTNDERFGNKWQKITSVQALEKSLEAYRNASVGRRRTKKTKVAGRLPSESTISPAAIRRRYPDDKSWSALRANDPNILPSELEWSARHFPEVVQQNPVLPLIALEDPNRGRRIQEVTKDALRRRKEQEILAVKEGNLRIDQWLEREKKNWVTTLLERFGENLWDSRGLDMEYWPSAFHLNVYLDTDDGRTFRDDYRARWGGTLRDSAVDAFFNDVIKEATPLANEEVRAFAKSQGVGGIKMKKKK